MLKFPVYIGLSAALLAGAASLRVTELPAAGGEATERRFELDYPRRPEVWGRLNGVMDSVRRAAPTRCAGYLPGEYVDPQRARLFSHQTQPSR